MSRLTAILRRKPVIVGILLAIGLAIPFLTDNTFIVHLLILAFLWGTMAAGYNLLMGYTGLLSLGHAAFLAVGAYTSVIMATKLGLPWPVGMLCAGIICGIFAFLLGFLVLRLKGAYFAMVTLGFGEIVRILIENWEDLTSGVYGVLRVPPLFDDIRFTYIFILLLMAAILFVLYRLIHSYAGRCLIAIREDEDVARVAGIDVARYKTLAFVVSAVVCGIMGAAMVHYFKYVYPDWASFLKSANLLVYTVVGGAGFFVGPLIAAAFFVFLPELSRVVGDYQLLLYALILVLFIIFIPQGLEPILRGFFARLWNTLRGRGWKT